MDIPDGKILIHTKGNQHIMAWKACPNCKITMEEFAAKNPASTRPIKSWSFHTTHCVKMAAIKAAMTPGEKTDPKRGRIDDIQSRCARIEGKLDELMATLKKAGF